MFKDKLLLVGVAALSAVATVGWVRPTPVTIAPQAFTAPILEPTTQTIAYAPPAPTVHRSVYQPAAPRETASQPTQIARNEPGPQSRRARNVYDDRGSDDRRYEDKRSTGESVAIIGGSAAAGAAIGGLAGGGKGAAIGALGGGAAGFVYDRLTRNK